MAENCKNCAYEITLNFCPSCGQKKAKRIDGKYVKDEIQYTVLHTNKGFFYTCKQLLIRPGHATREYVEGNRVNHYKPLALVFLLAGISAFLTHYLIDFNTVYSGMMSEKEAARATQSAEYMLKYNSFFLVALIPFFSLTSWLTFRKWGYNYFEHIVINAFFTATMTLISLLLLPVNGILIKTEYGSLAMMIIPTVTSLSLLFVFFRQFYHAHSFGAVVGRLLLFILASFLLFVLVTVLAGLVYAMVTIIGGYAK